ncbi:MAG: sulfotransferase, partial [Pseudonocardiaceae bacterium]
MTPPTVLYLGGLGRSGTTLLERMLAELPGVCSLGEVVHLWQRGLSEDERCGCGQPFSRCPFWTRVGEVAYGGWSQVDRDRVRALQQAIDRTRRIPQLAFAASDSAVGRQCAEYAGYYRRLYAAAAEVSGAPVVVDSSKNASLAFCLRQPRTIDLRVLHMVRDSRGVAYSWTKRVRRPERVDDTFMKQYSPWSAALLWDAHNLSFDLLRRLGTPTLLVRYEELLTGPKRGLAEMARFAGVPVDEDSFGFLHDHGVTLQPTHTVSGNPMRFRTGQISLHRDDEWRTKFPTGGRRLVSAVTLPLL